MSTELDRTSATQIFMDFLIKCARDGSIKGLLSVLEKGPGGMKPPEKGIAWHEWFQTLDDQSKEKVQEIIQEAVDFALFEVLVVFDGATGGYPVKGELSDFALYLKTYQDKSARKADLSQVSIRLNPADATEDLHDIFRWTLEETA